MALEDLRKMRLELHLLITGSQKGSKASSRGGKSEEACEIVSLVLQRHRDDLGEAEEISVEELLPEEEARKVSPTSRGSFWVRTASHHAERSAAA